MEDHLQPAPTTPAQRSRPKGTARRRLFAILLCAALVAAACGAGLWVAAGLARAMAGPAASALRPTPGGTGALLRGGEMHAAEPRRALTGERHASQDAPPLPHVDPDPAAIPDSTPDGAGGSFGSSRHSSTARP